jgi:hypothetical protein
MKKDGSKNNAPQPEELWDAGLGFEAFSNRASCWGWIEGERFGLK